MLTAVQLKVFKLVFYGGQSCGTFTSSLVCQNPGNVSSFYYSWTAVASTCYYINIDGYAGVACQYDIGVGTSVILPVRFSSWEVYAADDFDEVSWLTASEKNADYFLIERCYDGENFVTIDKISAKGIEDGGFTYYAKYRDIKPGETFYRITQIDKEGFSSTLPPKSIIRKGNNFDNFNWYCPEGSQSCNLNFYSSGNENVQVSIYDLSGKLVQTSQLHSEKGNNTAQINCNGIEHGFYLLVVSDPYSNKTLKFFKN